MAFALTERTPTHAHTQSDALGYVLLGFQPVITLNFILVRWLCCVLLGFQPLNNLNIIPVKMIFL